MVNFIILGIPWIIIGICNLLCPIILLLIRYLLAKENKRREAEPVDDTYDDVYIDTVDRDGNRVESKVPKVYLLMSAMDINLTGSLLQEYLDLTDIQNREFKYVL